MIEDDDDFREVVVAHIRRAGYEVVDVQDAGDAWGVVAQEGSILAVVVDFRLAGNRRSDARSQLRRVLRGTPIIGFTSWPGDDSPVGSPFDVVHEKPDVAPVLASIRLLTAI